MLDHSDENINEYTAAAQLFFCFVFACFFLSVYTCDRCCNWVMLTRAPSLSVFISVNSHHKNWERTAWAKVPCSRQPDGSALTPSALSRWRKLPCKDVASMSEDDRFCRSAPPYVPCIVWYLQHQIIRVTVNIHAPGSVTDQENKSWGRLAPSDFTFSPVINHSVPCCYIYQMGINCSTYLRGVGRANQMIHKAQGLV